MITGDELFGILAQLVEPLSADLSEDRWLEPNFRVQTLTEI
ncbi:hypothetical protein ACVW2L_001733 [Mucilaginibacter sp. HD30]